jgi:hypothetical protein
MKKILLTICLLLVYHFLCAQITSQVNPNLAKNYWEAYWITHPEIGVKDYNVLHFRKSFTLSAKPASFVIHISADTRYKLYINGKFAGLGPAKSDLAHWFFDTYDISTFLLNGKNNIAVVVWNQGEHNGYSQHSNKTALIVQGNSEKENIVNTNKTWVSLQNKGYKPVVFAPNDKRLLYQYYVAGATDSLDARNYPWNWQEINFDDTKWQKSREINKGCPPNLTNPDKWTLIPRNIPLLEYTPQRLSKIRKVTGVDTDPFFLAQSTYWQIPAKTKVSILLDNEYVTTGYPELEVSGGAGSIIKMTYTDGLCEEASAAKFKVSKGNRNQIEGKRVYGIYDIFLPDGADNRFFQPLWMRTFRYIQIDIETRDNPLTLRDLEFYFSAYPLPAKTGFKTDDATINQLWEVSWRTLRLCSQENQIDPYYEQMQYVGDTRVQSLATLFASTDDKLIRNSLEQFNNSRNPEGLTMSRYPSDLPQYSPLYSLLWVLMVNDYWMHREDDKFVKQFIPGILGVLDWFERQISTEKMIGSLPYLDFLDTFYNKEVILKNSKSQLLSTSTLFYVYTIEQIIPLLKSSGKMIEAEHFLKIAQELKKSVTDRCYDPVRKYFADTPDKKSFSQHANILAVLTDALPDRIQLQNLMSATLKDTSLYQCTSYFKFYMFRAMRKVDLGNEYLKNLSDWEYMLSEGMTTFGEWKVNPRSECHAWSASPSFDLISIVSGIESASPGFKTVLIKPNPGRIKNIDTRFPHPKGDIVLKYIQDNQGNLSAEVTMPPGLTGTFMYKGRTLPLKPGRVTLVF